MGGGLPLPLPSIATPPFDVRGANRNPRPKDRDRNPSNETKRRKGTEITEMFMVHWGRELMTC